MTESRTVTHGANPANGPLNHISRSGRGPYSVHRGDVAMPLLAINESRVDFHSPDLSSSTYDCRARSFARCDDVAMARLCAAPNGSIAWSHSSYTATCQTGSPGFFTRVEPGPALIGSDRRYLFAYARTGQQGWDDDQRGQSGGGHRHPHDHRDVRVDSKWR